MSDVLHELKTAFQGLQTLYQTYLPKVDPLLIHDLLVRQQEDPKVAPIYMVEVFTKPGTNSQALRERIWNATGMMPAIYDNGTHYVTNHRLTLEMLKTISDAEEVVEVSGDYTGSITGLGINKTPRTKNGDRTRGVQEEENTQLQALNLCSGRCCCCNFNSWVYYKWR
ncbi:hypothetical protein BH18THE2_BH18THE2_18760 [soil metagenome]